MLLLEGTIVGYLSYRKASGNLKNNYFSTRVVSLRNKLGEDAIHAVDKFKINLSEYGYQKLRVKRG